VADVQPHQAQHRPADAVEAPALDHHRHFSPADRAALARRVFAPPAGAVRRDGGWDHRRHRARLLRAQHTKFEVTPEGLFYTPNAHIGIALSVLFVGRVVYRMFVLYSTNPYAPQSPDDFAASPLTLAIFGLLAGYYVTYAIGLINWRKRVEQSPAFKT
jgi:hypothetical protein